jgi:hypothetical protein
LLIIFGTDIHISSPVGTKDPSDAENFDDFPPLPTSQATVKRLRGFVPLTRVQPTTPDVLTGAPWLDTVLFLFLKYDYSTQIK